jgi:OOP family OmpA-OmpF porin
MDVLWEPAMKLDVARAFTVPAVLAGALMFTGAALAQRISPEMEALLTRDVRGAADSPLTGRYEGSVLFAQTTKAFDEITLASGPAQGKTFRPDEQKFAATVTAQGKVTRTVYVAPQGRSSLEVMANFVDALTAKGFEPVFRCAGAACGESFERLKYRWDKPETHVLGQGYEHLRVLFVKDNIFTHMTDIRYALYKKSAPAGDSYTAIYGAVHSGNANEYQRALGGRVGVLLETVEPRAMEQRMVVVSAAEIGGNIAAQGKAIFYGILFDFDKADVKPESEPQLAEMAKFLRGSPQTQVYIIGHTDNKGTLDYNVRLSGRRADSVVKALAGKYQIDAKRLNPRGLGPLAPVASNRTDDGRAKNRRVELVEQ